MRPQIITGTFAVAAVLGAWAAVPAASAAPAKVESVPSISAPFASRALTAIPAGLQHALGTEAAAPAASAASSVMFGALWGVACAHPGDCLGVGEHDTTTTTTATADLLAGSSWRATGLHLPSGATQGSLVGTSHSSASPGILMAVGYYVHGSSTYPTDNIWTGNGWSQGPHQPAIPSGEKYGALESVSCASPEFCVATGYYSPGSLDRELPLEEVWENNTWRLSAPPVPSGSAFANLDTVSCAAVGSCVVSGTYSTSTGAHAWADSFDGAHWKQISIPQPQASASGIWIDVVDGVSCSSTTSCTLVGTDIDLTSTGMGSPHGFAETLANGTWTVAAVSPSPAKANELNSVDCVSSTFCVATGGVGSYNTPVMGEGDVAVWNGSTWTSTLINPGTNIGSELTGIDCTSTTYCVATGTQGKYATDSGQATSAVFNGISWTQHTAP